MSVYSPTEVYPSIYDEVFYNEIASCEVDPSDIFNMQFIISEKLADKGYHAVNLCYEKINGKWMYVLQFSYTQVKRFVKNMTELGYPCKIVPAYKPRYKWVVFDEATPMDLLHTYHYLKVIK